ncbi:nucleolar protein dao-5 isoform X2 [Episyrphus balteatus]|uniref:nucleolar protein dao-5 isoform X2 n=1 Tax=Episyrphus balteatus TaxID=286459 RepID=UPI002485C123|nr:nucleolar protein dao-5 isoform X2 [Episyrphus balteatus]
MAKCCVRGCSNKLEVGSSIRMFRFPALLDKPKSLVELSRQRRNAWLKALNRTNLPEEVLKSIGICSEHFITGSPARLKDNTEVDWIPTIKMGHQQRNRNEKKIISPSQSTTKLKRIGSVEKLSELEKLKNELKCKDELIKSYKDESLQLKHQQKKGRGISMRSGRTLQKNSKHKLIKPCIVRIRRFLQVKEEPLDEEFTPQKTATKTNTSKQDNSRESSLRSRASKEQANKDQSPRDRSSRNPTPVSAKSKALANASKRFSNSPKPSPKSEDPPKIISPKVIAKQIEESSLPKPSSKKAEEPIPAKASQKKIDESIATSLCLKKVEELLGKKPIQKKVEDTRSTPNPSSRKVEVAASNRTPNPNSKKVEELRTPKPSAKKIEEPVSAMASTRTRRAPKPNPKYANDDIITPKIIKPTKRTKEIVVLNEAGLDTDSGDDFFYGGADATTEDETNDDDVSEVFEANESSDFSDGDFLLKRKRITRAVPFPTRSNTPLVKRSRPSVKVTPVLPVPTPTPPPIVKPVELKRVVTVTPKPTVVQPHVLSNRKRKLEEVVESSRKEPPESIIARNKRLNIALYDSNTARPASPIRSSAPIKQTVAVAQTKQQPAQATSILPPKRPMAGPLSSKIISPQSTPKEKPKVKNDSPLLQRKSPTFIESSPELVDSANTIDDFETMPTFTIVNINDIINKKGDCLVQKRSDDEVQETTSPNSINRTNRRKTGHTTILSEKIDPVKLLKPIPKTPFPPVKKPVLQSNITTQLKPQQRIPLPSLERREIAKAQPVEKLLPAEKISPNKDKPAPRILNSVVGRKTFPVQPIMSKLDSDLSQEQTDDAAEKSVMVKENVGANKVLPTKAAQTRKLPAEKVCVQRQGNKLIKKITCFETWYVINIPETQEQIVKNCLDIPLITLSNAAKTIRLPSSSWSSKVTLYKLSAQMANKSHITPYTGEISDQSINEEDREKYQPSCVMFRRSTQQQSQTRMPYDRAVIFKMKTFFTNIDGKNVRLIGAPSKISSFEDIEVLLELVDELDLLHEFVETASTV